MGNKSRDELPVCKQHPEVPYPGLWRQSFGEGEKVPCGEKCDFWGKALEFLCYYFAAPGDVIKSLCIYRDEKLVCPFPHLSYETCRKSALMVWDRTRNRSALIPNRKDYHNELCENVFEQAQKHKIVPPEKPFFEWLDGCFKNRWDQFENEEAINEKTKLVNKDTGSHVRKYQIYAMGVSNVSRSEIKRKHAEIERRIELLKEQWAQLPADSAEDSEFSAKLLELEGERRKLGVEYYGVAEQLEETPNESAKENVSDPRLIPVDLIAEAMLKQCIASLEKASPDLHKIAVLLQSGKIRTRYKDGRLIFNDCDIAQEMSLQDHTARRLVEKTEIALRACLYGIEQSEANHNG